MTVTLNYSLTHRAILKVAGQYKLAPIDVRVLVALRDRGDQAYGDELKEDLHSEGSAVRRSIGAMRGTWLTGGDQRGRRVPIQLTEKGAEAVTAFDRWRRVLKESGEPGDTSHD